MYAALTDPGHSMTLEQPVLRMSDGSGELLPQEADVLCLAAPAPGKSRTMTFSVTVKPCASVSRHVLQFSRGWTVQGQPMTRAAHRTMPFTQDMRLEQDGVRMPGSVVTGDPLAITLPLMNMGRAKVINVPATASLPGETEMAYLTLIPGKEALGDFTGAVSI